MATTSLSWCCAVVQGEVEQAVKRHGDPDVEWSLQGMLRLAPPAMRRLFAPTLVSIRQAIGDVLNHPNTRGKATGCKTLLTSSTFPTPGLRQQGVEQC